MQAGSREHTEGRSKVSTLYMKCPLLVPAVQAHLALSLRGLWEAMEINLTL